MVQIRVERGDILKMQGDALIVNLFAGAEAPKGATLAVDRALGGLISRLINDGAFEGKLEQVEVIHTPRDFDFKRVILVGLGKKEELDFEKIIRAAGAAVNVALIPNRKQKVVSIVHGSGSGELAPQECGRAVVEGMLLSVYRYDRFKSEQEDKWGQVEFVLAEKDSEKMAQLEAGCRTGQVMAQAVNRARDMVNAPANHMTPSDMAAIAEDIAAKTGLKVRVLGTEEMKREGMGCLLGVAAGSKEPPCLIVLQHEGDPGGPALALVGKGLTFDSGGISLKQAKGMEMMKGDMAGGAAVLAAMEAIGILKPEVNVLGVVACTENLPSGTALKPGDVLKAMTGKTVEVTNTDAEGRLILADAVAYAAQNGAEDIIDVATLTGAAMVALGMGYYSGAVTNAPALWELLQLAASTTSERFWQLPGDKEYLEELKSNVADIKNSGRREGGATLGALFIGEFVGDKRWLHLDIAPTFFTDKEKKAYQKKGATGVAVRTLVQLALDKERNQ